MCNGMVRITINKQDRDAGLYRWEKVLLMVTNIEKNRKNINLNIMGLM
jgi:hypothetical protein